MGPETAAGNSRWRQADRALPSGCPGKVLWDAVPEGWEGGNGGAAKPFSGSFGGRLHRPGGRLPNVTARFVRGKWDEKNRALCGRDCFRSYCRGMWGVAWHGCPANGLRRMVNRTPLSKCSHDRLASRFRLRSPPVGWTGSDPNEWLWAGREQTDIFAAGVVSELAIPLDLSRHRG